MNYSETRPSSGPYPRFQGTDLIRLLPAPTGSVQEVSTGMIRLISVELYSDGLVSRWLWVPRNQTFDRDPLDSPLWNCVVEDDLGTDYRPDSGTGASASVTHRAEFASVPAVPLNAAYLRFHMAGQEFLVPLR